MVSLSFEAPTKKMQLKDEKSGFTEEGVVASGGRELARVGPVGWVGVGERR